LHEAIDRYERDSTICDIEQGGEFPQRFYLTSRCVVWDLPGGNARAPCNSRDAHDARTAGLTIDVNGAGPALRDATAGPRPRQVLSIPQDPKQRNVVRCVDMDTFAIHSQRNQLAAPESLQIPVCF
jgi:hypothetical protein